MSEHQFRWDSVPAKQTTVMFSDSGNRSLSTDSANIQSMNFPFDTRSQLNALIQQEGSPDSGTGSATEYTVDALARASGSTVRNVRAYQDRGLLPPPERRGRAGVYSDLHLSRMRLINNLLQRGYTLSNIKEMITAWEQGADLSQLLGLEQAISSPWTNETPSHVSAQELAEMFSGDLEAENMRKAMQLGLIESTRDGFLLKQPRLLNAGAELVRLGIPLGELFEVLEPLRDNVEHVASDLVRLAARLIDRYGEQIPPSEDLPKLAHLIWRLRPIALIAVESEVQRAMEDAANKFLIERVSNVFGAATEAPAGQSDGEENKA